MITLSARVEGERLILTNRPTLASGSVEVIQLSLEFDNAWDGYGKIALFWNDDEEVYASQVIDGLAVIPHEAMAEKGKLRFGVYGTSGDSRIVTEKITYKIVDGAYSSEPAESVDPSPTIIDQIETGIGRIEDKADYVKVNLRGNNACNLIDTYATSDKTQNKVTFTWSNGVCIATSNGASSAAAYVILAGSNSSIPYGLVPGKSYIFRYTCSDYNLRFGFYWYKNGTYQNTPMLMSGPESVFTIPSDATGLIVLLNVGSGKTVTNATAGNFEIMTSRTNAELLNMIDATNETILKSGIFTDLLACKSGIHNNVQFSWSGKTCSVTLTSGSSATGASVNVLLSQRDLPDYLKPGDSFYVRYATTDQQVRLSIVFYNAVGTADYTHMYTGNAGDTVPADAVQWAVRLYVSANAAFSETVTVSEVEVLSGFSLPGIHALVYDGKDTGENCPSAMTWFEISARFDAEYPATPADIPINSYTYSVGSRLSGFSDYIVPGRYYWICCLANLYNANVRQYIVRDNASGEIVYGRTADGGETVIWGPGAAWPSLKVLSIGSSFGQDCTVYAPFIIRDMAPAVQLTMGIVYRSGGSITEYSGIFDNDTKLTYSKCGPKSSAWTTVSNQADNAPTLKEILADEQWDIIMVNQSAALGGVEHSFDGLGAYLDKLVGYCCTNNAHGVRLGYLMPQAALGYAPGGSQNPESPYIYSDMVARINEDVLPVTPVDFVIPCGTAIESARGNATLNAIGNGGGLTYDAATAAGHLQEGLPVLLANYVTALKILELCGIRCAGVMGNAIRPNSAWVSSHAIPGQNGSSTGVTDANCLLAQKCAVAAVRDPFRVSVIE